VIVQPAERVRHPPESQLAEHLVNTEPAEHISTAVQVSPATRAALGRIVRRAFSSSGHKSPVDTYIQTLIGRMPGAPMTRARVMEHLIVRIQAGRHPHYR
jgi:hypothetical protein